MNKKTLAISVGIIVVLAIFFISFNKGSVTGNIISEGDSIQIPLSSISTTAEFYDYNGIEYFVIRSKSGAVKTAFNACDICYRAKKGYSQKGDDMVCNNCGNHYAINGLGTQNLKGGGCWPGYLESFIKGDYLVIKKSVLEKGRYRF